jgi:hypothetical protein
MYCAEISFWSVFRRIGSCAYLRILLHFPTVCTRIFRDDTATDKRVEATEITAAHSDPFVLIAVDDVLFVKVAP